MTAFQHMWNVKTGKLLVMDLAGSERLKKFVSIGVHSRLV